MAAVGDRVVEDEHECIEWYDSGSCCLGYKKERGKVDGRDCEINVVDFGM